MGLDTLLKGNDRRFEELSPGVSTMIAFTMNGPYSDRKLFADLTTIIF